MNTTINNSAINRLQVTLRSDFGTTGLNAQLETSELAEFNERVGKDLRHQGKACHAHNSQETRSRLLTNLRRQLQTANKATSSQKRTEHNGDEEFFDSEMSGLMKMLHDGGEGAMRDWLSKRHDPYERHELLRHAIENSSGEDKAALSRALDDLNSKHGKEIESTRKGAEALKSAIHKMETLCTEAAQTTTENVLRGYRSLFNSGEKDNHDEPTNALTLANRLLAKYGADNFSNALKDMRSQLASQMRLMQKKGAEFGPKMWLSMSDASSFKAIQSSFATASDLRTKMSMANVAPQTSVANAALSLLSVAQHSSGDKFAKLISGERELALRQKNTAFRLITQAVENLPITFWPEDKLSQRMDLIGELRSLAGSSTDEPKKTREARETREGDLERILREKMALLKKAETKT